MLHFSPTTGGFYHSGVHAEIPADAVAVTAARHRRLLAAQANGRTIVAGEGGRPVLAPVAEPHLDQLRTRASAAIAREARRRTRAIASLEQRVEDVGALALSQTGILPASDDVLNAALTRTVRIRALRDAETTIAAAIAELTRDQLAAYDPATDPRWPEWDA